MRFPQQLVIDAVCALIVLAVLVVPIFATQYYQQQAETNANAHGVTASTTLDDGQ